MRKIKLPDDKTIYKLRKEYRNLILDNLSADNINDINSTLLSNDISYENIILLPFDKLLNLRDSRMKVKSYYKRLQPLLSTFFSKHCSMLGLTSCCYCNINYTNPYYSSLEYDYTDFFHFIRTAKKNDLSKIINIGTKRSNKIINNYSYKIKDYEDLFKIDDKLIRNILLAATDKYGNFNFEHIKVRNEFTLDHILPQSQYPLLSLCLFNIIPSCYSCNSKLKKAIEISDSIEDYKVLSPTSSSKRKIGSFKLYFANDELDENLPNTIDGYSIRLESVYQKYINLFQLQGRYNFHKEKSFKLIEKRKIYTSSMIDSIEKLFLDSGIARTQKEIKRDIFGETIFNEESKEPFSLYLKDIASELKII